MRRFPLLLLICAIAALGVAGCGGDDDGGSDTAATTTETTDTSTAETGATGATGGGGTIRISADPGGDLAFEQETVTAKAGTNKIVFTNESSLPHDVKIEEDGEDIGGTEVVTDGTAEATVKLEAGKSYTFYCSVPGHRQAGMEGKLTVE
jgi:plastocyanin